MELQNTLQQVLGISTPQMKNFKAFTRDNQSHWPQIQGTDISQWDAFTQFALNQDFGELLNDRSQWNGHPSFSDWQPFPTSCTVQERESWYEERITHAVKAALRKLRHSISLVSFTSDSIQQYRSFFPGSLDQGDINFYMGSRGNGLRGFVVGLFRSPNDTVGSRLIDNSKLTEVDSQLNSLKKLAHFCRIAKTPYGFIYTNNELIVCRFPNNDNQRVNIKSIFLDINDSITSQQAIWYLCMMAIYDQLGLSHSG